MQLLLRVQLYLEVPVRNKVLSVPGSGASVRHVPQVLDDLEF